MLNDHDYPRQTVLSTTQLTLFSLKSVVEDYEEQEEDVFFTPEAQADQLADLPKMTDDERADYLAEKYRDPDTGEKPY